MKNAFFALLFLIIAVNISAQINTHIVFDTLISPRSWEDFAWRYGAEFVFSGQPEPLKSSTVDFKLRSYVKDVKDWEIRLVYFSDEIKIIGDTLFYWPGPHEIGDEFAGSFQVIPLRSGGAVFALSSGQYEGYLPADLEPGVIWCFDEDGKLHFLDQIGSDHEPCFSSIVSFFTKDSVVIRQRPTAEEVFDYNIIVKPTPHVGDTSEIHFKLTSNYDIPQGCDLMLQSFCFDIVDTPSVFDYAVSKGESLDVSFKFIPRAVLDEHHFAVTFSNCSFSDNKAINNQCLMCFFMFADDGRLKYVSNYSLKNIADDKKPHSFRPMVFGRDYIKIKLKVSK